MHRDDLHKAGDLLAGQDWQRPLARLLGPLHPNGARDSIDDRLVRRWASGERPIPSWVAPVLAGLLLERGQEMLEAAKACREMAEALAGAES